MVCPCAARVPSAGLWVREHSARGLPAVPTGGVSGAGLEIQKLETVVVFMTTNETTYDWIEFCIPFPRTVVLTGYRQC